MENKLERMFEIQDEMAARFIPIEKYARGEMPNKDVQDTTLMYLDCVIEEVIEMKREYPRRKFWKKGNDVKPHDEANAIEEFSDILHFLFAVARINGWDAKRVFEVYEAKYEKNKARFDPTIQPEAGTAGV